MDNENGSEQDKTLEAMVNQPAVNQPKRSKKGTYALIGLGGLVALGIYTSKKIWNYFYPPTFKRYFAAAAMLGALYSVTHCNKVNNFIDDVVDKTKKNVSVVSYQNKQLKNKNGKITTLKNEKDTLQKRIKELTGSEVEFSDGKPNYNIKNQKARPGQANLSSRVAAPSLDYQAFPGSLGLLEDKLARKYEHILYVNKKSNILRLYASRNKGLEFVKEYKCSTGKNPGPRTRQGDHATFEGIAEFSYRKASANLPDLYGDIVIGIKDTNPLLKGTVFCGADDYARIRAIRQGRNITNCGIITQNKDIKEIDKILGCYWGSSAIVVEHPDRPLARRR